MIKFWKHRRGENVRKTLCTPSNHNINITNRVFLCAVLFVGKQNLRSLKFYQVDSIMQVAKKWKFPLDHPINVLIKILKKNYPHLMNIKTILLCFTTCEKIGKKIFLLSWRVVSMKTLMYMNYHNDILIHELHLEIITLLAFFSSKLRKEDKVYLMIWVFKRYEEF